jgi:kumamolisin
MRVVEGTVRLPDPGGRTIGRALIVRAALTPAEFAAPIAFSVSLRMRDLAGLEARVASGALVPAAQMEADYLPLRGDYARVAAWLTAQGFTQTLRDRAHTTVFATGSVAQVARAFGVRFARVSVSDGEYTSAVSEPSVPAELAGVILSINALQPQFRLRHLDAAVRPVPRDLVGGYIYVTPDNVASAYNIPATATGAGQIIAIVGEAPVLASDLTSFSTVTGGAQPAGGVTTVNVDGGPGASPTTGETMESALDVEWAGALAPGAGIRLYLAQNVLECFSQIQGDLQDYPGLSVISVSYGNTEGNDGPAILQAYSQVAASLSAAGITVVASSGDGGSNPSGGIGAGSYLADAPTDVSYPASDPNVTGVGGTTVGFAGKWGYTGEVVWDELSNSSPSASGGGVSAFFAKPAWQVGGTLLAGETMRCVPDVAAISDADLTNVDIGSNYLPANGTDIGVFTFINSAATASSGTSLACPVWAAVAALINQARAAAGLGHIGLLNPHLYPIAASSAFNDVTSGSNGAYSAAPGYDLCTGIGSPNVANLIAELSGQVPLKRLANISVRSLVETGANITIAGFVIQGPAGTSKDILVRGIGPALAGFGVTGVLASPVLSVYDSSSTLIASDSGWGNAPVAGTSAVSATYRQATAADMAATGAFALPAGSSDSAMVLRLPTGNYTVEVAGAANTAGVALSEVYELDTSSPEVLTNISSRCFVGTGSGVAISGFVVEGSESATLLIRGIGPALGGFGLTGTLAQPTITLDDSGGSTIVSNTGWGSAPVSGTSTVAATYRPATAADMSAVGAFALAAGSADSAIVVTLPPGSYTAILSGTGQGTGTALAEVYEISGP